MGKSKMDNRSYRGMLQSADGIIRNVLVQEPDHIVFETAFGLSRRMIDRLKSHPEHILFSERSRIAHLGLQITCDKIEAAQLEGDTLIVRQTASAVIPGYPDLETAALFFSTPACPSGGLFL